MTSQPRNAQSASHWDTTCTSQRYTCIIISRALRGAMCNVHEDTLRNTRLPRTAGLCFYQDKLRLTSGGHTHRRNTRNVSRSGRAKCWHQLGTSALVQQGAVSGAPSILPGTHTCITLFQALFQKLVRSYINLCGTHTHILHNSRY